MSDNPGETVNYLRLLSMYMDLGTETVHDVFVYHSPGKDPHTFLKSKEETLIKLKNKRILNQQQCELLLKEDTSGNCTLKYQINLKDFDISLLTTLAINLFTNIQLPLPRKGWDNPPRNNDKSIAADLLRLRITRNVIVGHHPKARLSQDRFEEEWENVSEILLRIQQQITQGNGASFQEKIDSYGSQIKTREEYNEKLSDWHDDMSKRQDEVEDLIRKLEGFDAYFKSKCDRYERYIKLLVQGGTFVLSSFLDEQIKRRGRDLRSVLDENKVTLMQSITDPQHLDVLYPSQTNGQSGPLDITTWNVSILATVILQLFDKDIGKDIKLEISMIGDAYRNYADSVFVALDSNIFEDYVTDLKASLKIVSGKLGGDKANQYYQILADSKKQIGEHEFQTYMDELKSQGKQMKKFTDVFKETLQKTKDYLKDMIAQGISFKSSHELDLKMITLGTDEEKKQLAENILTEIWHEALDKSLQNSEFANVRKEVENILDEIRKSKSVKKIRVEQKCIILQISCSSPSDMLCMIDYFESSEFHESLDIISKELGYHFSTAFAIKAFIPVDNLWDILNHRSDLTVVKEEGIRVPISVSSPAGMLNLKSLFKNETIANSTNAIADALSKHFNETITLKVETDMKSFTNMFEEGSDSSSDSSLSESNIPSSTQCIPFNEPGDCLEEPSHTSNDEKPLEDKTENENKTILIDKLVICKDDVRNLVDDTAKTAQGKIRTEKDEFKKEAEKPKFEPIKITNSSSKETEKWIETQGQLSMSELDKALSYSDGEIEKQTNESGSQLQAEEDAGVKMVTSKAYEPLHQIREKLLTGDEEIYNKRKPDDTGSDSSSDSSISESNIQSSTQLIPSYETGECFEEQSHTSSDEYPLEDKPENENKTILIDKLVICKDDVRNVVDDTAKTVQGKIRTEKDEFKKEAEKPKLEPIKITNSSSKETEKWIETQGQLSMSELDKALSYSDGEIEKQTNESGSQLQAEEDAGVKMVTSKAYEPLHQIREKLLTGDEENKRKPDDTGSDSSSDFSVSESNIQSSTQLIPSYETGECFEEQSHTSSDEYPLEDKPENKTLLNDTLGISQDDVRNVQAEAIQPKMRTEEDEDKTEPKKTIFGTIKTSKEMVVVAKAKRIISKLVEKLNLLKTDMATGLIYGIKGNAKIENRIRLIRLQTLIIDGGLLVLRQVLDCKLQAQNTTLSGCLGQERRIITRLKEKKRITQVQYVLLYPPGSGQAPSISDLDITLIICLLRNLKTCALNPKFNWNAKPQTGDNSMEAGICRLKQLRHEIARISSTTGIGLKKFNLKWTEIEQILIRLNKAIHNQVSNLQQTIDEMKTSSVYADAEKLIEIATNKMQETKKDVEPKKTDIKEVKKYTSENAEVIKDTHSRNTYIEELTSEHTKLTKDTQSRVTDTEDRTAECTNLIKDTLGGVTALERAQEEETRKKHRDLKEDLIRYYTSEHRTKLLDPFFEQKDTPVVTFYVMPDMNIIETQAPLSHEKEVKFPIRSLSDVFIKDGEFSREVYLTADAGYGKTTFSQYLASIWCQAHSPDSRYTEYLDEDHLNAMRRFGLLFLVILRDSSDDCSIDEMIFNQIIKEMSNSDTMNMSSLQAVLHHERFLVILDGLDEWTHPEGKCKRSPKPIPHRHARNNCVILTTTRPWKLGVINLKTSQISKRIELAKPSSVSAELLKERAISKIKGLDIIQARTLVEEFNAEVAKCSLGDLESVPFLLICLIYLWSHNIQLDQSMTGLYTSITELLLSRTVKNYPDLQTTCEHSEIDFPQWLSSEHEHCEKYFPLLTALGQLAFHTLYSKTRENTLVFDSSIAEKFLSKSELKFSLQSGIITQSKAQVSALKTTSKISFAHKSVQEYFSALYMSRQSESDIQKIVQDICESLQDILDMSAVFVFISGINGEMMSSISRELMSVINDDMITSTYRSMARYYYSAPLKDVQNMYISCTKENRDNNYLKLCLQDVFIDENCRQENYNTNLQRLANQNNIKSVSVRNEGLGSCQEIIESFALTDLNNLQKIFYQGEIEEADIICFLTGTVKCAGVRSYQRCSMSPALTRTFQNMSQLESIYISWSMMSHDVLEDFLNYLTNRKSMKEIRLSRLSCTDHGTSCDGSKLDLSQHIELRTLELVELPLSQLNVNVSSLKESDVRGLSKPGLISSYLSQLPAATKLDKLSCGNCRSPGDIETLVQILPLLVHLKKVELWKISLLGERSLRLSPHMVNIEQIQLIGVTMSSLSFRDLVRDVEQLPHQVTVEMRSYNITPETECESVKEYIRKSENFTVTLDEEYMFYFVSDGLGLGL